MTISIYHIIISVLPGFLISMFIIAKDKHDKEPKMALMVAFVYGLFSTFPAIWLERFGYSMGVGSSEGLKGTFMYAFVVVAFSEELVKYLFLRFYVLQRNYFSEPLDGIVYTMMIGMGFATWENILYVIYRGGGINTGLLRMFSAVPAHAAFAVIMGYFAGRARFNPERKTSLLLTGFWLAVVAHGAYDFFIFLPNDYASYRNVFMLVLLICVMTALVLLFMMIRESKLYHQELQRQQQIAEEYNTLIIPNE